MKSLDLAARHDARSDARSDTASGAGRRLFLSTLLVAVVGAAGLPQAAQARPDATAGASEMRSVGSFDAIALRGSVKLVVSQGATASVQVQTDDPQQLAQLETTVEGNRLTIGFKRSVGWRDTGGATVTVVTPTLQAVTVSGSGDALIGALTTPRLKVAVAGSGNIRLGSLQAEELGVSVSGSGDVGGAQGQVAALNVSIAGSGDVMLAELKAAEAAVRIAGSGDAVVHAAKTLRVSIAGSGDVRYSGDAAVSQSVAGSGTVRKR
jgi:hypothetical protein